MSNAAGQKVNIQFPHLNEPQETLKQQPYLRIIIKYKHCLRKAGHITRLLNLSSSSCELFLYYLKPAILSAIFFAIKINGQHRPPTATKTEATVYNQQPKGPPVNCQMCPIIWDMHFIESFANRLQMKLYWIACKPYTNTAFIFTHRLNSLASKSISMFILQQLQHSNIHNQFPQWRIRLPSTVCTKTFVSLNNKLHIVTVKLKKKFHSKILKFPDPTSKFKEFEIYIYLK